MTKYYDTVSLHLGAAILTKIKNAAFSGISGGLSDRKIIKIQYPNSEESALMELKNRFYAKELVIDLYVYNKHLNTLRDELKAERV